MSEQSGRNDPADRPPSEQPPGTDRSRATRPRQSQQSRQRSQPRVDLMGDLQRWFIKSSAKNMRNQFEDQVRRTLGGQRQEKGDVWDVATTEIAPGVGEAPECQWCPICRAARHMRDSSPGLAGQLSGAGDAVASAVQDAVRAVDALLGRPAGGGRPDDRPDGGQPSAAGRAGTRAATEPGQGAGHAPAEQAESAEQAAEQAESAEQAAEQAESVQQADAAARPDSLTGEHGTVGWKPGDRLATTGVAAEDPWATATAMAAEETASGPVGSEASGSDGRGHGPGDRG